MKLKVEIFCVLKQIFPEIVDSLLSKIIVHFSALSCLCNILQVEDSWKQTEFIVLPHRDSKDVFILGGIDDIQALLDDSMVNTNVVPC